MIVIKLLKGIYVRVHRKLNLGQKKYTPFVLIGTYRTGSNLFIYSIKNHPEIVSFSELFLPDKMYWGNSIFGYFPFQVKSLVNERNNDAGKFIEKRVFKKYPNQIKAVGFKVFYQHLAKDGQSLPVMEWLEEHKEVKVIHLTRKNILDHYMSQIVANKTGVKVDTANSARKYDKAFKVKIKPDNLIGHIRYVEQNENWFNEKLSGHEKLEITYEGLVKDFESEQEKIFKFLGVKNLPIKMATKKLNTKKHSEQIENWDELKKEFHNTPYEWMFVEKV